jgi:alkylation response protein AidB-like acyl-CoA dehydrogenase
LKLTEEEKLIKKTAAEFVDKELIAREGAFLKQTEAFLPPGAPARRELDSGMRSELTKLAREVGLWCLELPEQFGGSAMSALIRVLIHREFGRSAVPFEPVTIPAFMFETKYGEQLAAGALSLSFAFDAAHKTGNLTQLKNLYRHEPDGAILQDARIDLSTSRRLIFVPRQRARHPAARSVRARTRSVRRLDRR